MRKPTLVAALAALAALVAPAIAQNLVVNGDFSAGENGWTRWNSSDNRGTKGWDASTGVGILTSAGSSFGWYQRIPTVPGKQYTISADWAGDGVLNWVELLFFNDTGGDLVNQLDSAPLNSSIISKVDGWGMNGGDPFPNPLTGLVPAVQSKYFYPSGLKTGTITATGTSMIVGLKTGSSTSSTAYFDNVVVTPEPVTLALLGIPALALIRRRR